MDESLALEGVWYSYTRHNPVLGNISFTPRKGNFTAVIGPNGCGKSTLLRLADGLITPDSGTITLDGRKLQDINPRERARRISYLPVWNGDRAGFSVRETVAGGCFPWEDDPWQASERARESAARAMEQTGIVHLAEKRIDTLSAGEFQLTLFARILAQNTDIVLLDEATSHLDISHAHHLLSRARYLADEGKSVVAAIHDINEAARFCTLFVLMKKGSIAATGTVEDVFREDLLSEVYETPVSIVRHPVTGFPIAAVR